MIKKRLQLLYPNLPVKTTRNLPNQNENKIESLIVQDEEFEVQRGLAENTSSMSHEDEQLCY